MIQTIEEEVEALPVGDSRERERLYREFAPVVRRLLERYGGARESRQQLATLLFQRFDALLESYDADSGVPLRPFLLRHLSATAHAFGHSAGSPEGVDIAAEAAARALPERIARLPARQRQVLIWRYYEERTPHEMAAALQEPLEAVSNLLREAVDALRARLASEP